MTFKPKLWVGVGAFALAGTAAQSLAAPARAGVAQRPAPSRAAGGTRNSRSIRLAQADEIGDTGESGEGGERSAPSRPHSQPVPGRPSGLVRRPAPLGLRGSGREGAVSPGGERGAPVPQAFGGEGGERGSPSSAGAGGLGGAPLGGIGGEGGVNTRYIFGFTEGADVERYGEREIENDTIFRGGKRAGGYFALANKTELEYGVSDNLLAAFGTFFSYHAIRDVPGLDDRSGANFNGFSGELKYRILDRYTYPFGLGVSIEPEWNRVSGGSGRRENSYALETRLYIDKELIPGRLFGAVNLLYEPEVARVNEIDAESGRFVRYERESVFGVSGALAYLVRPGLFVGGEVRYLAVYDGTYLNRFDGEAIFLGPTLSWRFAPRALVQAAYSLQVAGRSLDDPANHLNLIGFERHQARLRFILEF